MKYLDVSNVLFARSTHANEFIVDVSPMLKKLGFQKGLKNINIDSESHIKYKQTNLSFVVLRPNDLAQMGDLIGQGNKDIITWIGKTVGKNIADMVTQEEAPKDNQDLVEKSCKLLEGIGFGEFSLISYYEGSSMQIKIENPLYQGLDENEDIISMVYIGIFLGLIEAIGYQGQGTEIESAWKNKNINYSTFEFTIGGASE